MLSAKLWIGPAVAVVFGAAVLAATHVYANEQLRQFLDDYIAALPAGSGAGYDDADFDLGSGGARIGELRLPVTLDVPILGSAEGLLTLRGLVVEGYDTDALQRVADPTGPDGTIDSLARRIAWDTAALAFDGSDTVVTAGPGEAAGIAADHLSGGWAGVSADRVSAENLRIDSEGTDVSSGFAVASLSLQQPGPGGVEAASFEDLAWNLALMLEDPEQPLRVSGRAAGLNATGWRTGEPNTIDTFDIQDQRFHIDTAALEPSSKKGDVFAGPVELGIGSARVERSRFDATGLLTILRRLQGLEAEYQDDEEAALAAFFESLLGHFERAESLSTGAGLTVMEQMDFRVGDAISVQVARAEASALEGLRFGEMVIDGQTTRDALGNVTRIDRQTHEGLDLSALPAFLRQVFGDPITVESGAHAAAFVESHAVDRLAPVFDVGTFEATGYSITSPDGHEVRLGRFGMSGPRVTPGGDVELAFSIDGFHTPLAALEELDDATGDSLPGSSGQEGDGGPAMDGVQGAMGLADALRAHGIDAIDLDSALTLSVGLRSQTLDLSTRIRTDGIGDGSLAAKVVGMNFEALRRVPEDQRPVIGLSSQLAGINLAVEDHGGRRIVFEEMAADDPDTTAADVVLYLTATVRQMGVDTGHPDLGEAIGNFLEAGGGLALRTDMPAPAPFLQFIPLFEAGPAAVIQALGLQAEWSAP